MCGDLWEGQIAGRSDIRFEMREPMVVAQDKDLQPCKDSV